MIYVAVMMSALLWLLITKIEKKGYIISNYFCSYSYTYLLIIRNNTYIRIYQKIEIVAWIIIHLNRKNALCQRAINS